MRKIALITGATSGIGKAAALELAKIGYNLILTGRRINRLNELKLEIEQISNVETLLLNFDVRNQSEVERDLSQLPNQWKNIDILINNAGLAAGLDPIQSGLLSDWEQMIDTNLKGLLYVTKATVANMIERKEGLIINIGSIAGIDPYPNGNVYCATKAAVNQLTKAMRMDLVSHNIKVSIIEPGMVTTEFSEIRFKGDTDRINKTYQGFDPLLAQDIADAIVFISTRPKHVTINEMVIMPTAQASAMIVDRK